MSQRTKTHPVAGIVSLVYLFFMFCYLIHFIAWLRHGFDLNADLLGMLGAYAGMHVMKKLQSFVPDKYGK